MAPFTDPIRPIGPVCNDTYVSRTDAAERVTRRFDREQDGGSQGGHGHSRHPVPDESRSVVSADGVPDAGAYDDHGRTTLSSLGETPPHPHIDLSA